MNQKIRSQLGFITIVAIFGFILYLFKGDGVVIPDSMETASAGIVSESNTAKEKVEVETEYGFSTETFSVYKGAIKRNQFLADILLKYNVSYPEIDQMVKKSKDVFDVRRMVAGKKYTVFCSKDSLGKAQCFVYEPSATEYVVFDMRDSLNIYKGQKEITTVEQSASGIINSSLYEALLDNNTSPVVALELSEIYAWTIDFYRILKGDKFKVIYEEQFVEGESIGVGKVKAAYFNHGGKDFYAFRFKQGEIADYFDENAQSLRKAFLKAPLKFSRISSRYSPRRFHPVQKRWKAHKGTDYAAPKGTPIMATGDGTVTKAKYSRFNGNYVKIRHNSTYTTQYLHMNKVKSGIRPGKVVKQGDIIGYVGSTGLATGPHVCYRFWKNGSQIDHLKEEFPPSEPVQKQYMQEFSKVRKNLKEELDAIDYRQFPA